MLVLENKITRMDVKERSSETVVFHDFSVVWQPFSVWVIAVVSATFFLLVWCKIIK